MAFLNESDIEEADIQFFELILGYQHINAWKHKLIGRDSLKEVVLKTHLRQKLTDLNTHLPPACIDHAVEELSKSRIALSPIVANKEIYELIRKGIPVEYDNAQGREEKIFWWFRN